MCDWEGMHVSFETGGCDSEAVKNDMLARGLLACRLRGQSDTEVGKWRKVSPRRRGAGTLWVGGWGVKRCWASEAGRRDGELEGGEWDEGSSVRGRELLQQGSVVEALAQDGASLATEA